MVERGSTLRWCRFRFAGRIGPCIARSWARRTTLTDTEATSRYPSSPRAGAGTFAKPSVCAARLRRAVVRGGGSQPSAEHGRSGCARAELRSPIRAPLGMRECFQLRTLVPGSSMRRRKRDVLGLTPLSRPASMRPVPRCGRRGGSVRTRRVWLRGRRDRCDRRARRAPRRPCRVRGSLGATISVT